jgi:S-DNA-T family DNA segregation ATPase FtsK/SpoIIIE
MRRAFRSRHGGYPVLFPVPYESLSVMAAAAIGRWAYRHRSTFLPFLITGAAFLTAAQLHAHHRGWWVTVTAITVTVTIVLGIPHRLLWTRPAGRFTAGLLNWAWEKCGIDRPAERAYAATVVAVTGGWLAAAIAVGPTVKPLPTVALIGTVILGIPWWAHRRRRARVRAYRTIQAWPDVAENMGLPGSRIASIVVDAWGWTARVVLKKGTTTDQAISRINAIESGLGIRPGSARVLPDATRADRFTLRVIEADPHAHPIPWPSPSSTSVTRPVELGLSEDGQPVQVLILRRNVLVGGTTGSGKSGVLNIILATLAACTDAVIWGVDLKGGMELHPWASCLGRLATTPEQANELFRDAVVLLNQRAALKAAHGERVWEPTYEDPALVIVVDEYAELPDEAHDCADSIARRGRAVAVNLIAATQRPTQQAMGKHAVRSQMDVRVCLRVRERRDVDLVLGQGSFNSGWHAHTLTQPGTFLISSPEHTIPQRHRAYLLTDEQIASHNARYASQRPTLAEASQAHHTRPQWPHSGADGLAQTEPSARAQESPEATLWRALSQAGPAGVPIGLLVQMTGKGRTWVYERLRQHAAAGRVVQTIRGHWRATTADGPPPSENTP